MAIRYKPKMAFNRWLGRFRGVCLPIGDLAVKITDDDDFPQETDCMAMLFYLEGKPSMYSKKEVSLWAQAYDFYLGNMKLEKVKSNEVFVARTYSKNLETGELKIYPKGTKVPDEYNDGAYKELTKVEFFKMKKEQEEVEEVIKKAEVEEVKKMPNN